MKTMFVQASAKVKVALSKEQIDCLPSPLGLVSTVQHQSELNPLSHRIPGSKVCGAILGCDIRAALGKSVAGYLFIGTGRFHPLLLAQKSRKPVFVYDPYDQRMSMVEEKELKAIEQKRKVAHLKFLHAETIGILVSTKPGQQRLKEAQSLAGKLGKRCYLFLADNIDTQALQDFPFVHCFVNSACPRIPDGSAVPMVNLDDIQQTKKSLR